MEDYQWKWALWLFSVSTNSYTREKGSMALGLYKWSQPQNINLGSKTPWFGWIHYSETAWEDRWTRGSRKRSQPQNQSRVKNLRALGTVNLKTSRGRIASGLWQEIPTSKHLQCWKSRGLGEAPTPKQPTLMTRRYIPSILTTAYSEGKWKHRTKPEYWEVRL